MSTKPQFGRVARSAKDVAFRHRSAWANLVHAYVFAEAGGGTIFNIAPRKTLDGTISGATWEQGLYGPQLDFVAASNHHVDLNGNFGFGAVGDAFTIRILFNPDGVADDHQVIGRFDGANALLQFGHSGDQLRCAYGDVGATTQAPESVIGSLSAGTWALGDIVIFADLSSALYLDGAEVDTTAAASPFDGATEYHIGNRGGDDAEDFDGKVALVTAHSRIRLAKEINRETLDPFAPFRKTRRVFGFVPTVAAANPWFFQQKVIQRRCG